MTGRTKCHSGYVNSHHSYLETHSLLSSQRDSKSVHPFLGSFIPTCQQMRSLHTCTKLPSCSCVFWMCLCVLTKKLAALAHSQPASSDKPNESPEKRYLPALSCSVLSSLFSVFFLPTPLLMLLFRHWRLYKPMRAFVNCILIIWHTQELQKWNIASECV